MVGKPSRPMIFEYCVVTRATSSFSYRDEGLMFCWLMRRILAAWIAVSPSVVLAESPVRVTLRAFDRQLALETQPTTSASVSVGDVNGDGHLDILLAKGRHWPESNRILLGNGRGHFSASDVGGDADRTYSAALADLNGDGSVDLVVSNDRPDRKLIYFNDGSGRFTESGTFGDPEWPTRYVTLADLNGDGFPDIITANRNGSRSTGYTPSFVCFNDGKGGFGECSPLPTESSTIIVAADLDGDGAIDLFLPHRDGGLSKILWNDSKGGFSESTQLGPAESRTRLAAAADLDGDGLVDLVVGGPEGKGTVIYLNEGRRKFGTGIALSSPDRVAYSVAIADMNRDGALDLVIGYFEGRGSVFFGDGSGKTFVETAWNDGVGAVYGLAVGDFNGDDWPDIATARSGGLNAVWFSDAVQSSLD